MAGKSVSVEGIAGMVKGFKDFNDQITKNQQTGQKLAANAYKNDVQDLAPHKHGTYRTSIHVEGPFEEDGITFYVVGTDNVAAKQHEFGGVIKAKNGPYLIFKTDDGQWHTVKSVTQPAHPHFRPALDQNREKYIRMMKEAMVK